MERRIECDDVLTSRTPAHRNDGFPRPKASVDDDRVSGAQQTGVHQRSVAKALAATPMFIGVIVAVALSLVRTASAHSWVACTDYRCVGASRSEARIPPPSSTDLASSCR